LLELPKTLLLAGSAPGTGHVGEIILGDLVKCAGPGKFHCIAVVPGKYAWRPDPELAGLSIELLRSEHLRAKRWSQSAWGAAGSVLNHAVGLRRERASLAAAAVASGKKAAVGQVFAVLNNPMMLGLAHRVSSGLGVPLLTLVWDPPEYLLRLAKFDRWSRRSLVREFAQSLSASARVAVVSENMQSDYARYTRAPIQILRHGLPVPPEANPRAESAEWMVGFAGSMYSNCAWQAFLAALDSVGWTIAGKPLRLRVLSARVQAASRSRADIEYLGFRSTNEVQELLAECHACYLPQPFVEHLRDLCRYSFPTKLTNYMALGVPVLAHAPPYGAVTPFLREHPVGVQAQSLEPSEIVTALEQLLGDESRRVKAAQCARGTAEALFSDRSFRAAVGELLGAGGT
jgi:hypothetical protein